MKDIKGYEGLYAVTSCGLVWSYRRKRFLNPWKSHKGYRRVQLFKDGIGRKTFVHRLVAEAYIPNPENLDTVDHIDFNRENNCINNLRWLSRIENSVRKEVMVYGNQYC